MIASDTQKVGDLAREANQACGSKIEFGASETEALQDGEFHYTVPYRGHGPATIVTWLDANL